MTPNACAHLENDTLRVDVERLIKLRRAVPPVLYCAALSTLGSTA